MSEQDMSLVGRELDRGRYVLESVLGEGGMGSVYLAQQRSMERHVAIKIIHPRLLLDKNLIQRFHLEAKNLAKLRSPHCVTVHDFGETKDGLLYLVMELLAGHSLQDELDSAGPLAVDRMISYVEQISRGLSAAHQLGMVHRDLKPANINIEITNSGNPLLKVLDFGLSKIVLGDGAEEEADLTKTGQVFGTPRYMSPEQCHGQKLDARTDIYSLGLIAFESLIGQPVYGGKTAVELLLAHSTLPPPDLQSLRNDLRPHVIDAIYMAIAKKREHRWRSVEDFLAGLKGEITSSLKDRGYEDISESNSTLQVADTKPVAIAPPELSLPQTPPRDSKKLFLLGLSMLALGAFSSIIVMKVMSGGFGHLVSNCDATEPPAYNHSGQPCIDKAVIAYWDFDTDLLGRAANNIPPYEPDPKSSFKNPSEHLIPGVFGRGLKFIGERESRLVTNRTLALGDYFTVETWIKPLLEPENRCSQFVLGTLDVGSSRACDLSRTRAGWALMVHRNRGETFDVEFHFVSDMSTADAPGVKTRVQLLGAHPLPPNQWGHVAVVSTGEEVQIVVNGHVQTYARKPQIATQNARWLQFSGYPGRIDGNFAGELDAVRVSSKARPIEEIKRAYKDVIN